MTLRAECQPVDLSVFRRSTATVMIIVKRTTSSVAVLDLADDMGL